MIYRVPPDRVIENIATLRLPQLARVIANPSYLLACANHPLYICHLAVGSLHRPLPDSGGFVRNIFAPRDEILARNRTTYVYIYIYIGFREKSLFSLLRLYLTIKSVV